MLFPITEHAPAKLNLYLHITGKRQDGYHLLESLVAFTEFGDTLQFYPDDAFTLDIEGDFAPQLDLEQDNLILKAARALKEHMNCKQGARIVVHKSIPVSGGLGGGSANAAATLRGLLRLWNMQIEPASLAGLAARLGSDVTACLYSETLMMEGVGDKITLLPFDCEGWMLLANPRKPLATAEVYGHFDGRFDMPCEIAEPHSFDDLSTMLASRRNALEAPAINLCPEIGLLLEAITATSGCRVARMAGSGSSCFGLFETGREAEKAQQQLKEKLPDVWLAATPLMHKKGRFLKQGSAL